MNIELQTKTPSAALLALVEKLEYQPVIFVQFDDSTEAYRLRSELAGESGAACLEVIFDESKHLAWVINTDWPNLEFRLHPSPV